MITMDQKIQRQTSSYYEKRKTNIQNPTQTADTIHYSHPSPPNINVQPIMAHKKVRNPYLKNHTNTTTHMPPPPPRHYYNVSQRTQPVT